MFLYRKACEDDMFDILKLYSEFTQEEPCAQALGIAGYANPGIAESLLMLAQSGKIMLCCEDTDVLGMAVFYNINCQGSSIPDIEAGCAARGLADLSPIYALSSIALDVQNIGRTWRVDMMTYLEMLVTTMMARGRGVASGIVQAVEEDVDGVIAAVASSKGTLRILKKREWKIWNTLDCKEFLYREQRVFAGLENITSYVKDARKQKKICNFIY